MLLETRRSILVELVIKEGNKFVDYKGHILKFYSLISCIEYLRGLGLIIKIDTLTKYIYNEKVFIISYVNTQIKLYLSIFNKIGLIMDEYKNLKADIDSLKINKNLY